MKSEKGITLLSLIIYIILLTFVTSMLAMVSQLFFANTKHITDNSDNIAEFNKFNMYFIEDVKNNKNIYKITEREIIFEDGTVYKFQDNGIYKNKVKICSNIYHCSFTKREEKVKNTTKQIITVRIIIDSAKVFDTTNEYVLKYW